MNTKSAAFLFAAMATTGCLLLSGCTGSADAGDASSPASTAPATAASAAGIASASPSTVPAPEKSDGVSGVMVDLSSATSAAGEPVQVTVTVPEKLDEESVVLVSPAGDDTYSVITAPVPVNDDLQAFMTVNMGKTMVFRAIVPKDDLSDAISIPEDAPILGQSEEFTITVE